MQADTKEGFDIVTLIEEHDYFHAKMVLVKFLMTKLEWVILEPLMTSLKNVFLINQALLKKNLNFVA